jgi:hypothetical protein
MSASEPPSEEELRAAYEAQMQQIRVEDLLLETVVSMINFGMRRTGLVPGAESERDAQQVHLAIESVRALMPLVEPIVPEQVPQIRDALSQLQLAFVRMGGASAGAAQPAGASQPAGAPQGGGSPQGGGAPEGGGGPQAGGQERAHARPASPRDSEPHEPPIKPGEPGPAQRSGRLWVPGDR